MPINLVFAGTPEFAVPVLAALLDATYLVSAVYTQPDRPAGRGQKSQASPVKQLAVARGIPVEQPPSLRTPEAQQRFAAWRPDVLVVVAYGLLLPKVVLGAPSFGCLNVHASLLPRWRGAAPIQRAILAGDAQTGVTIMQIVPKLDAGPMLLKRVCPIAPTDTAGELHHRLAQLGAQAALEALPQWVAGTLPAEPQDDSAATYAAKLEKSEAEIDWAVPAVTIDRIVRAFNPWPVAQTRWRDAGLRIWRAEPRGESATAAPGTVVSTDRKTLDVATGAGVLRILEVQLPAGRRMAVQAFLAANDLRGQRFGGG